MPQLREGPQSSSGGGGAPGRLSTCWFLTQGRPGKSHQGAQEPLWAPLGTFILTKGFVWKQIAPKKREILALPARLPREPRDPLPAPEEAEGPSLLAPRPRPLPSCASKVLPPTGGGWLTQKELGLLCPQKQPLETRHQHKAGGRESRQPTHAGSMCLRPREGQRLALVTQLWDRQKQPHRGRVLSPPKPLARCHPPSPTASTSWATWCHLRLCGSSERPRWDTARSPPCSESTSVLAPRPRPRAPSSEASDTPGQEGCLSLHTGTQRRGPGGRDHGQLRPGRDLEGTVTLSQ